jgi:hypothetical protein
MSDLRASVPSSFLVDVAPCAIDPIMMYASPRLLHQQLRGLGPTLSIRCRLPLTARGEKKKEKGGWKNGRTARRERG